MSTILVMIALILICIRIELLRRKIDELELRWKRSTRTHGGIDADFNSLCERIKAKQEALVEEEKK